MNLNINYAARRFGKGSLTLSKTGPEGEKSENYNQ